MSGINRDVSGLDSWAICRYSKCARMSVAKGVVEGNM